MSNSSTTSDKVKINDRVKRAKGNSGCCGIVVDVRSESSPGREKNGLKDKEKALMAMVRWDNGTVSYFSPESLEVVKDN